MFQEGKMKLVNKGTKASWRCLPFGTAIQFTWARDVDIHPTLWRQGCWYPSLPCEARDIDWYPLLPFEARDVAIHPYTVKPGMLIPILPCKARDVDIHPYTVQPGMLISTPTLWSQGRCYPPHTVKYFLSTHSFSKTH